MEKVIKYGFNYKFYVEYEANIIKFQFFSTVVLLSIAAKFIDLGHNSTKFESKIGSRGNF